MSDGGKGSKPRPFSVTQQEYDTRWDAIFGRDLKEDLILNMPGTTGKLIFKDENESSGNNTDNRNQVSQ